ncbi:MAG: flagellin FliC3 [Lachnospiraceae bacterium]|nr:flagellin FliC3 [Lachnospiraceae bacterium]
MRINYNVSAMLSNNALANNDNLLAKSLERLSSGLKINHAKDNPAGLAMGKRMNAQIEGLSLASQNAGDGVSVIEIADGALGEVSDMLQRMNELAVKSANGTMTEDDRQVIQEEIAQLKDEITRISETTEFNGQKILNGEFDLKGYTSNIEVKVNSYTTDVPVGVYEIQSLTIEKEMVDGQETGNYLLGGVQMGADSGFPDDVETTIKDELITLKADNGFEMKLDISNADFGNGTTVTYNALSIDVTGIGAMRLQIGANEGQVLEVDIPAVTLQNMGIEKVDVSTQEASKDAIDRIEGAIKYVSKVRGRLGAYQNRLESTISSLDNVHENVTAAYSRIMDVDMAEEMTNYTTYQVLTQAGTSMLAQANERPSQVLQLLQ